MYTSQKHSPTILTFHFGIDINPHFSITETYCKFLQIFFNPSAYLFSCLLLFIYFNFTKRTLTPLDTYFSFLSFCGNSSPKSLFQSDSSTLRRVKMHSVEEYNPTLRLLLFEANELQPQLFSQCTLTIFIFYSPLFFIPVQYNLNFFSHVRFGMKLSYFINVCHSFSEK